MAFVVPGALLFGFAALNWFVVKAIPEDKFEPHEMETLRKAENQLPKSTNKMQCKKGFFKLVFELIKPIMY